MAKKQEIQTVTPPAGVMTLGQMNKPSFLQRQEGVKAAGTEELKQFVIVPRAKVVQKSAGEGVRAMGFGTGDLMLSPTGVELARITRDGVGNPSQKGPAFFFTPLFFFVDWATWNPIQLKGALPAIAHRTNDARDPIVAKSRDKNLRLEPLMENGKQREHQGIKLFQRHVEHLNFICVLHNHPLKDPFILTFARGEHFVGKKFSGLIRMRDADLFGCVFQGNAQYRPDKGKGDWYGIEVSNPDGEAPEGITPWVSPDQYDVFKQLHAGFKETFATVGIQADMSDAEDLQAADDSAGGPPSGPREM